MWWRRTSAGLVLLSAIGMALPLARAQTADQEPVQLQLDVKVNGYPLNLVAAFFQLPDGGMASTRAELGELGVAVPGEGAPEEIISLKSVPGLSYVYDDQEQVIDLDLPDGQRVARSISVADEKQDFEVAASGTGLVVNYAAFAAANYDMNNDLASFDGGSLSLDAHAFSRFGNFRQTGILGTTTFSDFTALRLDSTFSYSSQKSAQTYSIGDVISGGLAWTRPVRLGGGQARRNFDLRPDLITRPLPQIAGSAEVPSTLTVFIGGNQAYSGSVPPGPFRIDSLPVFTNSGTARVVLKDSTGRETESEQEFYTSPQLLKTDLYDFSVEAGVVRRDFGTESFGYDTSPVALASARYGVNDTLTAEAHGEFGSDLIDVGIGAVWSARALGMFRAAAAASVNGGEAGFFLHGGWEGHFGNLGVNLSTSRTFGDYNDLAAVTERPVGGKPAQSGVPRALDQISLNYSMPELQSGIGASFIHRLSNDGTRALVLAGSYSQNFTRSVSGFISGYADFGDAEDYGVFLGLSMPLGKTVSNSTGMNFGKAGWSAVTEASKPSNGEPGSYGWRVGHGEGATRTTTANGTYHGSKGAVEGRILQQDGKTSGNIALDGSAILAGGGVFFGNTIYDSFAVVDAGAPGVTVEFENRYAGKTGKNGKLLLPKLRSYHKNKIAIDVAGLPLNAAIPESEVIVVPRELSGVVVDFGVKTDAASALVILTDGQGKFLPEGVDVTLAGSPEPAIMGYDGQVYLTGLAAENTLTVTLVGKTCQTSFSYVADGENQTSIGPLQCL